MGRFRITKGKNIRLKGAAEKKIVEMALPSKIAIQPSDFRGLKLRPAVKEGDSVKRGTTLFTDKKIPDIKILSPIAGKVAAINRGAKRAIINITIEAAGTQDIEIFQLHKKDEIPGLSREAIIKTLLDGGLWCAIRQRPFSHVADPQSKPKSIFVQAMNTEPLALDVDTILEGREEEFQLGLELLRKLTQGKVHLCVSSEARSKALTQAKNVDIHQFSGPHPAGNVSTHIHHIDPIKKGDVVWYVQAQHVLNMVKLFTQGTYSNEITVAITGDGAQKRVYAKTIFGAPVSSLLQGSDLQGKRVISGSILTGTDISKDGFLCFYDSQITVIPEGGKRRLLGWMVPGFKAYSFSKTFVSSFLPEREVSLDTDVNGSERAIVLNHIYDQYVPLDIMTFFLLRAVLADDIEEAEKLGILECDEEDFALCTFACPSKVDVGAVIRSGLDKIEKEG